MTTPEEHDARDLAEFLFRRALADPPTCSCGRVFEWDDELEWVCECGERKAMEV